MKSLATASNAILPRKQLIYVLYSTLYRLCFKNSESNWLSTKREFRFKRADLYLDALFDQILDGEGQIPSVEESESCDLENKEPGSAGY